MPVLADRSLGRKVVTFPLLAVVVMVLAFGSSAALASAYGVAVTGLMVITTILTFFVVRYTWGYPLWVASLATGLFIVVDLLLFASCSIKFVEGGWLFEWACG